jgi:hypothetical protein
LLNLTESIDRVKNMAEPDQTNKEKPLARSETNKWDVKGYQDGSRFATEEADYDDLAAIHRAGSIPVDWDIFRAEILNTYLGSPSFDFQAYTAGFARACLKYFEKI